MTGPNLPKLRALDCKTLASAWRSYSTATGGHMPQIREAFYAGAAWAAMRTTQSAEEIKAELLKCVGLDVYDFGG